MMIACSAGVALFDTRWKIEVISTNEIATASYEFFVMFRYWLASGGIMMRNACGKMMKR